MAIEMGLRCVRDPRYSSLLLRPFIGPLYLIDRVVFLLERFTKPFASFILALLPWRRWVARGGVRSHCLRSILSRIIRC